MMRPPNKLSTNCSRWKNLTHRSFLMMLCNIFKFKSLGDRIRYIQLSLMGVTLNKRATMMESLYVKCATVNFLTKTSTSWSAHTTITANAWNSIGKMKSASRNSRSNAFQMGASSKSAIWISGMSLRMTPNCWRNIRTLLWIGLFQISKDLCGVRLPVATTLFLLKIPSSNNRQSLTVPSARIHTALSVESIITRIKHARNTRGQALCLRKTNN